MTSRLLQHLMPDPATIRQHRSLRLLQHWLDDANLWHLNRYSLSSAIFIGFLISFVPLPVHTPLVALLAIWWRANLPIALAAVWLSNPLTMPVQFYVAYETGAWLLHQPKASFAFELSLHWLREELGAIWQPLLLGCLVCGVIAAAAGAASARLLWRMRVLARWRARQQRRQS